MKPLLNFVFVMFLLELIDSSVAQWCNNGDRFWRCPSRRRDICRTVGGEICAIPFYHNGRHYDRCMLDRFGRAQCPTELIYDWWSGHHIADSSTFENCDLRRCQTAQEDTCFTEAGNCCQFPFTHGGRTYHRCEPFIWGGPNHGRPWCSTRVDRHGNHIRGNYGFCDCDSSSCGCSRRRNPYILLPEDGTVSPISDSETP